jgi:tRNA(fMet)-specific endonuclease VapC
VDAFLAGQTILPFGDAAARASGGLAADLQRRGAPIGPYDILIAGHALSIDAQVVTSNVAEFSRVRGLTVVNWRI